MESGAQSALDCKESSQLAHSNSLGCPTVIQNLQVIADNQSPAGVGTSEPSGGGPYSSRVPGQPGLVCLTKLSDEEFENQLQLFQGRLSSIFDPPAQKQSALQMQCRATVNISS